MSRGSQALHGHIGVRSATALVIANVIGAGVFTTTGFQSADLGNPYLILLLWGVGGLLAYCGALCYAELGAAMPEAGAEYVYLRETYGPTIGFMSAFVSMIAGFPAPIAAALKSLIRYLSAFFPVLDADPAVAGGLHLNDLIAIGLVWLLVAVLLRGRRVAIGFSDLVTMLKVGGIVGLILAAAAFGDGDAGNLGHVSPTYDTLSAEQIWIASGTSLIFVMYCYSGWNAAAYVASEIVEPQRNLPRALLTGTAVVTVLYLALNAVYLYGADVDELAGKIEVGLVASRHLFGTAGAGFVTFVLGISLLASATAMMIAGPRVFFALGRDVPVFAKLAAVNENGLPRNALLLQGVVVSFIVVSGRVDQILQYAGFTLAIMSALAVSCVIALRVRRPDMNRPFRATGYPLPAILYLSISVVTMYWAFQGRPVESSLAFLTVIAGGLLFLVSRRSTG